MVFFQEVLSGGTNALMEYSYLVKKVVFQIDILPIIKLISALFVHLFLLHLQLFYMRVMGIIRICIHCKCYIIPLR